jgi:hypothetical protein
MGAKGGRSSSPPISTLSAKAMPPLWQYLCRVEKRQTSASSPPRAWTPHPERDFFHLQGFIASGANGGERGRSSSPPISPLSAKAMPPLWQYFVCV